MPYFDFLSFDFDLTLLFNYHCFNLLLCQAGFYVHHVNPVSHHFIVLVIAVPSHGVNSVALQRLHKRFNRLTFYYIP